MGIRKKMLWRIPVISAIGGIVVHNSVVRLLGRFVIVTLPDGTMTADLTRQMVVYGILFLAVLLIGGMAFVRELTCREIFYSASIVVIYAGILLLTEWIFDIKTGFYAIVLMYLHLPLEWSDFVGLAAFQIWGEGTASLWMSAVVQIFAPYFLSCLASSAAGGATDKTLMADICYCHYKNKREVLYTPLSQNNMGRPTSAHVIFALFTALRCRVLCPVRKRRAAG